MSLTETAEAPAESNGDSSNTTGGAARSRTLDSAIDLLNELRPRILDLLSQSPLRVALQRVDIMRPDKGDLEQAHVMWAGPSHEGEDSRRLKRVSASEQQTNTLFICCRARFFRLSSDRGLRDRDCRFKCREFFINDEQQYQLDATTREEADSCRSCMLLGFSPDSAAELRHRKCLKTLSAVLNSSSHNVVLPGFHWRSVNQGDGRIRQHSSVQSPAGRCCGQTLSMFLAGTACATPNKRWSSEGSLLLVTAMSSYDETLLAAAPALTRQEKQAGYSVDLLANDGRAAGLMAVPDAPPSSSHGHVEVPMSSKEVLDTYNPTRTPWWRTRKWLIIFALLAIVAIGAIVGGAVGGTVHHHHNTDVVQPSSNGTAADGGSAGGSAGGSTNVTDSSSSSLSSDTTSSSGSVDPSPTPSSDNSQQQGAAGGTQGVNAPSSSASNNAHQPVLPTP
ncbi:hypothetical protein NM688_g9179 [Phlebia brevispora]|uniref:Uncharacterized protein n=1 Tax=Phlebia brevispora TaxID=194682 RepID=A0ACC1RL69_9APHY|nr:hypothetical protein NM688_g9179 [Phlebia brevispora]